MDNNFTKLAQDKFSFLVDKYGFRCVTATPFYVRFESNKIFVTINYDKNRSYEVDVEIGQKDALFNEMERPFSLSEILREKGVAEKETYKTYQAADPICLANCVSRLSRWLEIYAAEFLQNDRFSFKRLSDFRKKECDQYELETKLFHIRSEVHIAWNKKDYPRVSELYQSVENYLSEAEKKKLTFAKHQITKKPIK
jgi:hypothetical protein